jgi:hypothetical protein
MPLLWLQPEKSPLTTEPGKGDQVTVVQQSATRVMSRKCLAVSTRNKVSIPALLLLSGVRP